MIKFLESPREDEQLAKRMFPQLFELSPKELQELKGGNVPEDCDAVCTRPSWGGDSCPTYGQMG